MNSVIKIRVLVDHDNVIFRDIEVANNCTFADLHNIIQEAFAFDNAQMASFYVSNEDWEKGQEITLMDMGEKSDTGEPILLMNDVLLKDIVFDEGQKLLYVFDFFLMWCFYVDIVEFKNLDENVILPRITQHFGEAPDQYAKSPEINFEIDDSAFDEMHEDAADINDMFADTLNISEDYIDDRGF